MKWRKRKKKPKCACIVYGLFEEGTTPIRYVGQTQCTLDTRLSFHRHRVRQLEKRCQRMTRVEVWVSSVTQRGGKIGIRALDKHATWDVSEILWIDRLKREGADLLNMTRGGRDSMDGVRWAA